MYTNAGKILKTGQKILQSADSMGFLTDRLSFPDILDSFTSAFLRLYFTGPTTVRIDWGDGKQDIVQTRPQSNGYDGLGIYKLAPNGAAATPAIDFVPAHTYSDNSLRTVTIFYPATQLVQFQQSSNALPFQDFAFVFGKHSNLNSFSMSLVLTPGSGGAINNLDLRGVAAMNNLLGLGISNIFHSSSPYYGSIPAELIKEPLFSVSCGDGGFDNKPFAATNLDKLVNAKNTLRNLSIYYRIQDTNGGDGPLPANFDQLTLDFLLIFDSGYTVPPAVISSITTLKTLYLPRADFTAWGDLSGLVNLTYLSLAEIFTAFPLTLPPWFASLVKLTTLNMQASFPPSGNSGYRAGAIDTWVDNIYSFATTPGRQGWKSVNFDIGPSNVYPADRVSAGSVTKLQTLAAAPYNWKCTYNS